MSKQNKTLLIHNDTKNNQTTAIVVDEKDIFKKAKELLKKISKDYSTFGLMLSAEDKTKSYAVAYEKDKFIIVFQNGLKNSAKLYGNWEEALANAKKIISPNNSLKRLILDIYKEKILTS